MVTLAPLTTTLYSRAIEPDICREGGKGTLLPASVTEWEINDGLRGLMYAVALAYFFLGVSIVADVFMGSIETVTSRRKQQMLPSGRVVTVHIWNDTVANLTLMALGSSAPEILLAVTELFGKEMYAGELGPATIVGSASFNLLMIVALCIVVIPSSETRKVEEVPVLLITVLFMFIAYLWLVFIISIWTPEVVTIEEAVITLMFLPVLVIISYLADVGYFGELGKTMEVRSEDVDRVCELLGEFSRDSKDAVRAGLSQNPGIVKKLNAPTPQVMSELRKMVKKNLVNKKSRAARRVEATRTMTGGKKVSWGETQPTYTNIVQVSGLTGASIHDTPLALAKGKGKSLVQFFAETQQMCDDMEEKPILLHRSGDLSNSVIVRYEIVGPPKEAGKGRQSLAKGLSRSKSLAELRQSTFTTATQATTVSNVRSSMCFVEQGGCSFEAGQDVVEIKVKKPDGVCCDDECNQFSVEVMGVLQENDDAPEVLIGTINRSLIVMTEKELQGRLSFAYERLLIPGAEEKQVIQVMVQRMEGCQKDVVCNYRTERLTAVPGFDYTECEGTLEWASGITEAFIEIEILPKQSVAAGAEFLLILEDPEGVEFDPASDGGDESEILTIEIGPRDLMNAHFGDKMMRWLDERVNFDEFRLGNAEYKEQIVSAIFCNGSYEEQQEASALDWVFHLIALPWKLVFMFVPPTAYCGGWVCFILSLVFIGALTAFIGDLAELFGCVVGMPDLLTAISFVALGTSMPDLFASKTAAMQDPTADASIVNVTGSNSVNVFLGLGLPWTIGSVYWYVQDWPNPVWAHRYPDIAADQASEERIVFVVRSGDLVFSVIIFCISATVACTILLVRRRKIGAELGGPRWFKITAAVSFVCMWMVYITLSGWWSLRQNLADATEKTGMFVGGAAVAFTPLLFFLQSACSVPKNFAAEIAPDEPVIPRMTTASGSSRSSSSDRKTKLEDSPRTRAVGGSTCTVGDDTFQLKSAQNTASVKAEDLKAKDLGSISLDVSAPAEKKNENSEKTDATLEQPSPLDGIVKAQPKDQAAQEQDCQAFAVTEVATSSPPSCAACCLAAGNAAVVTSDVPEKKVGTANVGIVSVQRGLDADGGAIQQYTA